jgi:cell fate regulator YaaT (PSP1 superfamily)
MNPFVVGIRFQKVGKIYHFDASDFQDIQAGDFAVVETTRGRQLGQIIQILTDSPASSEGSWKPILRKATPRDLLLRQSWQQKEVEAMINCRAKAADLKLEGVKIVSAEFSFDGSRLSFFYSTESGDKLDLRTLRRSMQRTYPQTQIEMHQIGPRDVAKILGGLGACGLENRCCSQFLTDFSPISIKMAKEQGISLTPSEITGMCGRLRCCLVYEYEQYVEARKQLPKRGKRVVTPLGEAKVIDIYPLREAVLVHIEGKEGVHEFLKHEIQPWDELEALRQKSQAPCDRHEGGECTCGRGKEVGQPGEAEDTGGPEADLSSAEEDSGLGQEPPAAEIDQIRAEPSKKKFPKDRPSGKKKSRPRKGAEKGAGRQAGRDAGRRRSGRPGGKTAGDKSEKRKWRPKDSGSSEKPE